MNARLIFRKLVDDPDLLILPGVYDALSARIAERSGFKALVSGGNAAIGSLLGGPDMGQSNMRDYADHYARIAAAVEIPLMVDADTGFGEVHNVAQTVRAFEVAGVSAVMISDQVFPNRCGYFPGKQVVPVEEMIARVKAAVDARRDPSLTIIARTDAFAVNGIEDAIERACLYREAGADIGRPQGIDTEETIARVRREVPGPFFAILSQAAGRRHLDFGDLERLGVSAVTLPTLGLFSAAFNVARVFGEVARTGSMAGVEEHLMSLDDYYDLTGLQRLQDWEKSLHEAAAELAARRTSAGDRPNGG